MPTFKITVAYDGTQYVGWQRQAAGTSIQGLLEEALADLDGRAVPVVGAGRTDAGVHALGQVASFSLDRVMDASTLARAINARLPDDVRVLVAEAVRDDFHARFAARLKTYRYRLWNEPVLSPFERLYAWHVFGDLDVPAMDTAAQALVGRHDFAAFQTVGNMPRTTERTMVSSRVRREGPLIVYEISGDGFLRHMVRAIIGTLVEIGRGRRPVEGLADALKSRDRGRAGPTAPAEGLFLVAVEYGDL